MNESLESLITQVHQYVSPSKELTLLDVGGRGYFENPTSDLLGFFLKPDAHHGLRDLFLSAFLECLQISDKLKMAYVTVEREATTIDGSRIDLEVHGLDWCLLIENKIRHWQANPFETYEAHARRLGKSTNLFAILSPDGKSEAKGWTGVSYKHYCQKLREQMAATFFDRPVSKWQIFAREFVLHLENELELHHPNMTDEQVAFVENYTDQMVEVQKLMAQYREFIRRELKRSLEESLPGKTFEIQEASWASHVFVFLCTCPQQWGQNDVGMLKAEGTGQRFFIRFCLDNLSEPRLSKFRQTLNQMKHGIDGKYPWWVSRTGYDSCREAIAELCKLAQIVDRLK